MRQTLRRSTSVVVRVPPRVTHTICPIVKRIDNASPEFFLKTMNGTHFEKATLVLRLASGGDPIEYYKMEMEGRVCHELESFLRWRPARDGKRLAFVPQSHRHLYRSERRWNQGWRSARELEHRHWRVRLTLSRIQLLFPGTKNGRRRRTGFGGVVSLCASVGSRVLEFADGVAVRDQSQICLNLRIDVLADESHRPIRKCDLHSSNVSAAGECPTCQFARNPFRSSIRGRVPVIDRIVSELNTRTADPIEHTTTVLARHW